MTPPLQNHPQCKHVNNISIPGISAMSKKWTNHVDNNYTHVAFKYW